jgi:hypothetical protein
MKLLELTDEKTHRQFHEVPLRIYRSDPDWVPHLVKEIDAIFDRGQNRSFAGGDAKRWILLDRNFDPVGRVAAFFTNKINGQITRHAGIGFYECIDNPDYSTALLTRAESWLQAHGIDSVVGPVNFGERHQFWGCRVSGSHAPIYQENHNPRYYEDHFLNHGYKPHFESLSYEILPKAIPEQKLTRMHHRLMSRDFTFSKFRMDRPAEFIEDYLSIASSAFQLQNRIVKIDKETILHQLNIQKGVIKEDLIWFAYHKQIPAGVMGHMMNWSGMVNNAMSFPEKKSKTIKGFLVAIRPEYQRSGVLAGLLHHTAQAVAADGKIDKIYACGIAEYSKNVRSVIGKFGGKTICRHVTFRKQLKCACNGDSIDSN